MSKQPYSHIVIVGPTGSGKSRLGMSLAHWLGGGLGVEIINCDSVQIYRGFDIGAAKPSLTDQEGIKHHLLDIKDAHEHYDAMMYARDAQNALLSIKQAGKIPIIIGGTGLYLRALWQDSFSIDLPSDPNLRRELDHLSDTSLRNQLIKLDPDRAKDIHPNDRRRCLRALELVMLTGKSFSTYGKSQSGNRGGAYTIYMNPPRETLHQRIYIRAKEMIAQGLIGEVQRLLDSGVSPTSKPMQAIGYKQCVDMLSGRINSDELLEKIVVATRQYAKRQCTWFGKLNFDLVISHKHSINGRATQLAHL